MIQERVNQFEDVYRENSNPKWGYNELNQDVNNCRNQVAQSGLEKLAESIWKTVLKDIPKAMATGESNPSKFNNALGVIRRWVAFDDAIFVTPSSPRTLS